VCLRGLRRPLEGPRGVYKKKWAIPHGRKPSRIKAQNEESTWVPGGRARCPKSKLLECVGNTKKKSEKKVRKKKPDKKRKKKKKGGGT